MPYYNSPIAYQPMYGMPGGYGQTCNPGGMQQAAAQHYEIIHVNGEPGARALQMAPNSNAIVMDDTAPIIWLCQTDGAGYKTVQPFDIAPHQTAPRGGCVQFGHAAYKIGGDRKWQATR